MATFKATLSHHLKSDKTSNIRIRVTHNKKVQYIKTGYYILPKNFKNGEIKNDIHLDLRISEIINEFKLKAIKLGSMLDWMTCEQLVSHLKKDEINLNYFDNAKKIIDEIESVGTKSVRSSALRSFRRFIGNDNLSALQITSDLVKGYDSYLRKNGIKPDTYLDSLRTTFNLIKDKYNDEDTGIVVIPNNPFRKYKFPKRELNSRNHVLVVDELRALRDFNGTRSENFTKNVFLLMFYLIGVEAKDLFYGDLTGERFKYKRFKTKKNISIRIEPEAREIIDKIDFSRFSTHKSFLQTLNTSLHGSEFKIGIFPQLGIDKKVTTKWARHTWATIARNECGISKDDVSMCLGHSFGIAVTDVYIKEDFTLIDELNRKVIDYVNSDKK